MIKHSVSETLQKLIGFFKNSKKLIPNETEAYFLNVLQKKYEQLSKVQEDFRQLAIKYGMDSGLTFIDFQEGLNCENIAEEINKFMKNNVTLFNAINQQAHDKCSNYNKTALEAIILSISSSYLKKNHSDTMLQAEKEFIAHQQQNSGVSDEIPSLYTLPQSDSIYPFIEEDIEFPKLNKIKQYTHLSVTSGDVAKLDQKLNHLYLSHEQSINDLSGSTYFYKIIQEFFNFIYQQIIALLGEANASGDPIEQNADLAQNVDNIINGVNVTERARQLHRYNSRISPLISIIYDKELTEEEQLDLIEKLAKASPFRFPHEKQDKLNNLLISGGKPTSSNEKILENIWQRSALHHAVECASEKIVEKLIQLGAPLDAPGDLYLQDISGDKVSALHIAVAKGNFAKVKLLVDAGADVNAINAKGQTPLHAATNSEIADYLLTHGADCNKADREGNTALHLAATRNSLDVVKRLLSEENIELNYANNLGSTPLHFASHWGITDSNYAGLFATENKSLEKANNLEIMKQLVQKGAQVNAINNFGYTPLHMAVNTSRDCLGEHSHTSDPNFSHIKNKVNFLCDNGADVNCKTYNSNILPKGLYSNFYYHPTSSATPLVALYQHDVFENKKTSEEKKAIAEILVRNGADPKQLCKDGKSLLHACAHNRDATGLAYFLGLGLDPNHQAAPNQPTPLHELFYWQSSYDNYERSGKKCLELLIEHGVDPNKTMVKVINVDTNILNPNLPGAYLNEFIVEALFTTDNAISKQVKEKGIEVTPENQRTVLKQIWEELGKPWMKVEVPLLPEIYGMTAFSSRPVPAALKDIRDYRDKQNDCRMLAP